MTLEELQAAHVLRQSEWCPDQVPDLSFRGNEMAGEVGEACNVIKKLERERHGWRGSRDTLEHLGEELADVVHTAVLCAITAGIDLGPYVVKKFNETSEKNGLKSRIRSTLSALPAGEGEAVDRTVAQAIVAAIDELRREEGDQVTVLCDNPDFNGQPNNAVVISAGWTNWQDFRVSGHTLLGALQNAVAIKAMAPEARPQSTPPASEGVTVADDGLTETMWAEVVHEGEDNSFLFKCDEAGNRDGHHYEREIVFDPSTFPVGTKIIVYEPAEGAEDTAALASRNAPSTGNGSKSS